MHWTSSGSNLSVRLLVSWLMGKSPPSRISPGDLKRFVVIFWNHGGFAPLAELSRQHRISSFASLAILQNLFIKSEEKNQDSESLNWFLGREWFPWWSEVTGVMCPNTLLRVGALFNMWPGVYLNQWFPSICHCTHASVWK